jgi:pimeloyl-ACP methyl ester carboxylesterase
VPVDCLDAFDGYELATGFTACPVPIRSLNGDLYPTNIEGNRTLADFDAVVIEGVGHYPMLERPEEFNRLLAEMLDGLVGSEI